MSVKRAIYFENALSRDGRPAGRRWLHGRHVASLVAAGTIVALTACGSTPAAPSQPTVQAVATQGAGVAQSGAATAVAGASPAAATAVAAASPAAATAQAAAAPVGATAVSVVGTAIGALASPSPSPSPAALAPSGQTPLRIADASLADATPWLSIQNDGDTPVDIGGWRLQVGGASAELPDDAVVQAGTALTIHAGEGTSSEDEVYLGDAGDVLAMAALPGAPVRLTDGTGQVVTEVTVPRF
jgi:hypothetical protein